MLTIDQNKALFIAPESNLYFNESVFFSKKFMEMNFRRNFNLSNHLFSKKQASLKLERLNIENS